MEGGRERMNGIFLSSETLLLNEQNVRSDQKMLIRLTGVSFDR